MADDSGPVKSVRFHFALFVLISVFSGVAQASEAPSWFAKDYRSKTEWGFYCEGEGKTEALALQAAHLQCSQKMCLLFGVEVDSQVKSVETLKDVSVNSTVVERCPNVRVVGRIEKKKSVECEDNLCHAYALQLYPKAEYDREYARLNQPTISQTLEKTIVVREGNDTFQDPKACQAVFSAYSVTAGESESASQARILALESAQKTCANLDYRDSRLQNDLLQKMLKGTETRDLATRVYLAKEISAASTVDARVQLLLKFEKDKLGQTAKTEAIKKIMAKHFYALSFYFDESPVGNRDYLQEVKTCAVGTELVQKWPKNLTQEVTVCSVKSPLHCVSLNILMLRAQWAACLCRNQFGERAQSCTSDLMQGLDTSCTSEITPTCLLQTNAVLEPKYGVKVHFPND